MLELVQSNITPTYLIKDTSPIRYINFRLKLKVEQIQDLRMYEDKEGQIIEECLDKIRKKLYHLRECKKSEKIPYLTDDSLSCQEF